VKIGVAADHGGFEMKRQLAKLLATEGHEVVDFGNKVYDSDDDYPDFAIPLARAVATGDVKRGVLVCGSGVGASVAANKVNGVRAALCEDHFSARQGVEDDDMNIVCFGGRTMGIALAWDCAKNFLDAKFSGAERHRRRLAKVTQLENSTLSRKSDRQELHAVGPE
jgi:ribose 5-phosphate isomerase B